MVKNLSANTGDIRDVGWISGLGRSPGGGHGKPLQYSCLENLMDRGAWQLAVLGSHRAGYNRSKIAAHVCRQLRSHLLHVAQRSQKKETRNDSLTAMNFPPHHLKYLH